MSPRSDERIPILYLAPWVDIGGSDTATVDWFRFLDRRRFALNLITTQPSSNRRLGEVAPYVDELWELPQLLDGQEFPRFILGFVHSRRVQVVHVMNARLGFDLLPEMAALEHPPQVVVQLHGEEPGAQGYVRYVAVRYGNLVDAFSMTTRVLDERLEEYEIGSGKRRYIPIGVDAENEFNPERIGPPSGGRSESLQILLPSRLVSQKNPLLAVEVADELHARELGFQLHIAGDGPLSAEVQDLVARRGLGDVVVFHGPIMEMAPLYAAADVLLLTSDFETGHPRAISEAMAMAVPVVSPRLASVEDFMPAGAGYLVDPSAGAAGYADAICALAKDARRRRSMGEAGRSFVREQYTVQRMAAEHAALYEELLSRPRVRHRNASRPPAPPAREPQPFRRPSSEQQPLVSVIVPCFNHARYLPGCLESVRTQSHKPVEAIVVDDGSDEPETLEILTDLERSGWSVSRMPANRGPSAARNVGIEQARGRYILPLDADDKLTEKAVADLVRQLAGAPEHVGFIYPNLQFFGNRRDYWEAPPYNLDALLDSNFCAVSALFDREIFDRGLYYPEDIVLGQEDWDFVLTLAEHGIYGEPAGSKTLLVRKQGFSRNDFVDLTIPVADIIAARHPALFENRDTIRGEWKPALSLVGLGPLPDLDLAAARAAQSCQDFEILEGSTKEPPGGRLAEAYGHARGRYMMATHGPIETLLEDPAFVEKTLRIFGGDPTISAIAFADGGAGKVAFQPLEREVAIQAVPSALCWVNTATAGPPPRFLLPRQAPLEALARWQAVYGRVQWRHLADLPPGLSSTGIDDASVVLEPPAVTGSTNGAFSERPTETPPALPGLPRRWGRREGPWRPVQTRLVCRHRHPSNSFVYTDQLASPAGHVLDHVLGCAQAFPLPGTVSLTSLPAGRGFGLGETVDSRDPSLLGFLEERPLSLLDPVLRGPHRMTGQELLAAGEDDPLLEELEAPVVVGWIEPQPIRPRLRPEDESPYGLIGLVRSVDLDGRRHCYGIGEVPPGLPAGELGALLARPTGESLPLWIRADGRLVTDTAPLPNGRPAIRTTVRWAADPLRWTDFSRPVPKARAVARRAIDSTMILTAGARRNGGERKLAGYLLRSATSRTLPLYASIHPVTGDQLLSTSATEGPRLGYRPVGILGHLVASAPLTGELGIRRPAAPWATHFGVVSLDGEA